MSKPTMKQQVAELAPLLDRIEQASVFERPQLGLVLAAKMAGLMMDMAEQIDELGSAHVPG